MELIGKYNNGNFTTEIYSDGTKVRYTNDDAFKASFAENIDIKICNYCDMGCVYCHEDSTVHGKFGDVLNEKFLSTLHPYQEVAIGGGDPTSHPDLIPFLQNLKRQGVIANLTVNQHHFMAKQELIKKLVDEQLIYGLGVSLMSASEVFLDTIKKYPNAVIHVINGVVTPKQILKLSDRGLKLLILGYKDLRRGVEFANMPHQKEEIERRQKWLCTNLANITNKFKVVSFDNLAIDQLNVKRLLTDEEWDEFYMGDDGSSTFYIDMVERKFAQSSTAPIDKRYTLMDSVDEMFNKIKIQ